MKRANCSDVSFATSLLEVKPAAQFGEQLLAELGVDKALSAPNDHPALAWRRAGLFDLTGAIDGPPRAVALPIASAADGAMLALKSLSQHPEMLPQNGAILLGERARLMGLTRNGRASPGGFCRLIDAKNGRFALNLARNDDWGLLPAWLEEPASTWQDVDTIAASRDADMLVHRGGELGLAISLDQLSARKPWFTETVSSPVRSPRKNPLVVDLSSLWAGPLAGNLLHLMGADVIKVESISRLDGARTGNAEFYQLLNGAKQCAAFDFVSAEGRAALHQLISAADIVIEASRPRALRQLGIDAESLIAQQPGKVWLRMMAHGEDESRIGFGDDIGVAAGLCTLMEKAWGEPYFVGDAIADPLSGIFGALAAQAKWQAGSGCLINLSMKDVVRFAMQIEGDCANWPLIAAQWQALEEADDVAHYPMRKPAGAVQAAGANTRQIMARLC